MRAAMTSLLNGTESWQTNTKETKVARADLERVGTTVAVPCALRCYSGGPVCTCKFQPRHLPAYVG